MPPELSLYMLTCNNAETVALALRGARMLADEIVVVDSGSTDGTLDIVRQFADHVIQRPWPGFRDQYQFAHTSCSHQWVMFLDADEEISADLAAEVRAVLAATPAVDGYRIPRCTFFIDRWIQHGGWRSDSEIRLCRKGPSQWRGDLHACIHVDGDVASLQQPIYHYTYRDIADQLDTVNSYSSIGAADLDAAGKTPSLVKMFARPIGRFGKEYFLKAGFRDGIPGLIIAVNTMMHVFNKYAKLWERQRCRQIDVSAAKQHKPSPR